MKKLVFVLTVCALILGLLGFVACSSATTTTSAAQTKPADGGAPGTDYKPGPTIEISNFAFNPETVTIAVGTTVNWVNDDSVQHTVTSDIGAFDSGGLAKGGTFSFTFTAAGTYGYHCTFHSSMKGTVTVQ
jgi:plastocyanin